MKRTPATSTHLTRRGFVVGAAGTIAAAALAPRARASRRVTPAPARFLSRPDLHPPRVDVTTRAPDTSPGLVFVAPFLISGTADADYGALIVDNPGEPVWFKPVEQDRDRPARPALPRAAGRDLVRG